MSVLNPYFATGVTQGVASEQDLIEDLIIECLDIYSVEVQYVPRKIGSKDQILGEDRLSQFEHSYPIAAYFENIDNFEGGGFMIQKFGLMVEQSATLTISRKKWLQLIGNTGNTILPARPAEGDLIYFPLSKGLFEIKFVQHQDPFYQLGKLYVYKLQVELFQYASERIDTGNANIDVFETLKTFSLDIADSAYGGVTSVTVTGQGTGYTTAPAVSFIGTGTGATATAILGTGANSTKVIRIDVTYEGTGYTAIPTVRIGVIWVASAVLTLNSQIFYGSRLYTVTTAGTAGTTGPVHTTGSASNGTAILTYAGTIAVANATVDIDIDKVDSYGDNNRLQEAGASFILNTNNIFGDPL